MAEIIAISGDMQIRISLTDQSPGDGRWKVVADRQLCDLKRSVSNNPDLSSKVIFEDAGVPNISKSTRNCILEGTGKVLKTISKPILTADHRKKTARQDQDVS